MRSASMVILASAVGLVACGRAGDGVRDASGPDAAEASDSVWREYADLPAGAPGMDAPRESAASWEALAAETQGPCSGPVYATLGNEGGTLEHCGGSLVVPAGLLTEPITFGIAPAEAPAPPVPPSELGGQALHFTPDHAVLPGRVTIALPHDNCPRISLHAVVDGVLEYVEPCEVTATQIGQDVKLLGTFVAVKDCYPYVPSPRDLGSGTFTYTYDGKSQILSLPGHAYAFDQDWGPGVFLTLNTKSRASFQQVNLAISAAGFAVVGYINWDSA